MLQPIADDESALFAISGPLFRETVVGHIVALNAECVPDNLGGKVAIVAVDRLLDEVSNACTPRMMGWY